MSHSIPLDSAIAQTRTPAVGASVALVLAAWLIAVVAFGARHAFVAAAGVPPLALLVAFASPLAVFVAAYRLSKAFRAFVLSADPRVMLAMQAWRFGGFGFIALYAHSILPAYFAWPAGLGDMSIALAAPWLILSMNRRPDAAPSRAYVRWNVLGILDLVVAISLGAIGSLLLAGPGRIPTGAMAELPLVLIPVYLVPLFLIMHIAALLQVRHRAA